LRAGLRAGLGLPYECNAGGCGSCKFELVSGAVDDLWPEAPGIRPKERERGRRLACQSIPRGNCEIKLRTADSYVPAITPQRLVAQFVGRRFVTSDIHEFDFLAAGAANFLPGQYALLRIADAGQDRAYSMSNQPNAQGLWRFMVRRVPKGKVSNALFDLQEGAEVGIDGPYGIAHLRSSVQRDIVCIAGGSGLAPMVSIINGALAQPALGGREAWLFYGAGGPPTFQGLANSSTPIRVCASIPPSRCPSWQKERIGRAKWAWSTRCCRASCHARSRNTSTTWPGLLP
jgi:toluene monooxygenase electron transfer component